MTTSFSSLPIVDLSPLKSTTAENDLQYLSQRLHDVFATTGFAYLVNAPLSFAPDEVLFMAKEFFSLPEEMKMSVSKRSFVKSHGNTYRGWVPSSFFFFFSSLLFSCILFYTILFNSTTPSLCFQAEVKKKKKKKKKRIRIDESDMI